GESLFSPASRALEGRRRRDRRRCGHGIVCAGNPEAYSIYLHQILIMPGITIKDVAPKAALPGGEVVIEYSGRELAGSARPEVRFGDFTAQVMMASSDHIIAKVPDS